MATITLKDFQEFARPRISDWLGSPAQFPQKLKEIFDFAVANEKFMDSEANAWFDNLLQVMANIFEEGLAKLPDSPEKRNNLRLVALTKNKHHRAAGFLRGLGSPLPRPFPVAEAAKPVFLASLQAVLDVLFDATRQTQNGVAQFACLSMLYWTIDELNVAFYLAERRYATQSYSHIRTVYDLLEKVELFLKQPTWAEVWGSDDKRKILKELSPAAVRTKLGKPKFNAMYSLLSEISAHGTFEAIKRRTSMTRRPNTRPNIGIRIGGVPWDSEVVASISCCIIAAMSTLIMAVGTWEDRLHIEEVSELLKVRSTETTAFLQKYFVGSMNEAGMDTSELLATLNNPPTL